MFLTRSGCTSQSILIFRRLCDDGERLRCSCSRNDRVKSTTVIRLTGVIFRDSGGGWFWCAAIARRTCVVFLLRTDHSTLICKHALAVRRRYMKITSASEIYIISSRLFHIHIRVCVLFLRFFFLFAHTSLADATEWKSTVMGSANACARYLVIDSPARLPGHYIARSRAHGKIRVYDNPAARPPGHCDLCAPLRLLPRLPAYMLNK